MSNSTPHYNFNNLSVKDLVEARDTFHVHLINKRNVIATAIGRYLVRQEEIDKNGKFVEKLVRDKDGNERPVQKGERTLENSMVIDISYPCILVFVEKWETEADLMKTGATNIVPKNIYMPDGRIVPVCTVVAPKVSTKKAGIDLFKLRFPDSLIGGGFPLLVNSQGSTNIATVGCIVTNGHTYYALTNKHVTGEKGHEIQTIMGNGEKTIGKSSGRSLGKVKFNNLYPGWQSTHLLVSCDVGLIEISDMKDWKTEILGIKRMDELYDINVMNLTLGLIAEHKKENGVISDSLSGNVVAHGAVSGLLKGEVMALFYRYKTIGGMEYVSDFLISGRNGKNLDVHHGDSGAVWLLETVDENNEKKKKLQPLALHWGQHSLMQNKTSRSYAYSLSTCLSNVCRELDVELVRDWNEDLDFSWGETGHYSIGNRAVGAIDKIKFPKLAALMTSNANNISYDDPAIKNKIYNDSTDNFTPLVDVPDTVFKSKVGGISRFPYENPNHYADIDLTRPSDGKSLLTLSKTAANFTVPFWQQFYDDLGMTDIRERGLLPFRVKQIFREMVKYLRAGNDTGFICAAGVLGHYIGDSCQPLHGSQFTNGDGVRPKTVGVHTAYETTMIDNNRFEILAELKNRIDAQNASTASYNKITKIETETAAATACLKLMEISMQRIPPISLNDVFYDARVNGSTGDGVIALWDNFKEETKESIARGARYLAKMWEGAWKAAGAETNPAIKTNKISPTSLKTLYNKRDIFLKSYSLDQIGAYFTS